MVKSKLFCFVAVMLLSLLVLTYSNSFHNGFHFDDFHTVTNNSYIKNIGNIPLFFKDGTTSSSLPSNQSYRPVVTATLAIDYWLGKGLGDTFYFHLSMFVIFVFQGILTYFFYRKIFEISGEQGGGEGLVALLAVAWYLLHPANAETINYVIARSDSISAMFVVCALFLYSHSPFCKKWHLYLVPALFGMLTKPIAGVFALLLLGYIFFFEEKKSLPDLFQRHNLVHLGSALKKAAPALLFTIVTMLFVKRMDPPNWTPGGTSQFQYVITQPYVVLRYFASFFLPLGLSADTDLAPFKTIMDVRFLAGSAFVVILLAIAVVTSAKERLRPVSFGIIWFFITLLPTSLIPLAEVMNDHRVFLPYIGLMISVSWSLKLLLSAMKKHFPSPSLFKYATCSVLFAVLAASAYGTHRRNEVWKTEESLWRDVTEKSPGNGRGMMNYGLTLMAKGDYAGAEKYFTKGLELCPYYAALLTNMGVLKEATGKPEQAEGFFARAIAAQPGYPESYFFYARFLKNQRRFVDAATNLQKTIELSAAHLEARYLLMAVYLELSDFARLAEIARQTLRIVPDDRKSAAYLEAINGGKSKAEIFAAVETAPSSPEYFLNLSLGYYRAGEYEKSIEAANRALKLKPDYDPAYNNICAACNGLKQWDKAIEAGERAVKINPGNSLAANNLAFAKSRKALAEKSGRQAAAR